MFCFCGIAGARSGEESAGLELIRATSLNESSCVSHYFVIVPITLPGKLAIRILLGNLWENRWLE
jgi:hypothetical protein